MRRGLIEHRRGRFDLAERCFRQLVSWDEGVAVHHSYLGCALRSQGKLEEAALSYRRAVEIRPDYPAALFYLGWVLRHQGKSEQALVRFERAVAIRPDHLEALLWLGITFQDIHKWEESAASFTRLLNIQPDHAEGLFYRGISLQNLGRWEEAGASFAEVLRVQPNHPEALFQLGFVLQNLRRWEEAAARFRQAAEVKPDHPQAFFHLGYACEQLHRWEEAGAAYARVNELSPGHAQALFRRAAVLARQRHLADAEVTWVDTGICPEDAQAWLHLVLLYLRSDDLTEAAEACRQLAALRPEYQQELSWLTTARCRLDPPVEAEFPIQPADQWQEMSAVEITTAEALAAANADTEGHLVSVVTVCRNAERFIASAIASVRAQRYSPIEHVIQDGASTDGTCEQIRRLGAGDKLTSAPDSCGLDALITAAARCGGEYIAVCWADDELATCAAGWAVRRFRETGADVVYGDQVLVDSVHHRAILVRGLPWSLRRVFRHEFMPLFSSAFFRRSLLLQLSERLTLWDHDEYEFWVWLGLLGRIAYFPGVVSRFHVHDRTTWVRPEHSADMMPGRLRAMRSILSTPEGARALADEAEHALTGLHLWMTEHSLSQGHIQPALDHFRTAIALYNGDARFRRAVGSFGALVGPSAPEHRQLIQLLDLLAARAQGR